VVGENLMKIGQRFCLHSYFVSRKGMEKILHYFTHTYIYTAVDIDIHYIPDIRQYSVLEDVVSVIPEMSDTANYKQ
jgi:hypothetical protein